MKLDGKSFVLIKIHLIILQKFSEFRKKINIGLNYDLM